jgi:phosphatidylserine decarboxylase
MRDQAFMTLMRLLPKSALSTAVGMATRAPLPAPMHRAAMKLFAKQYRVALDEAEHGFEGYPTFADFFARKLKDGLRPIDAGEKVLVSPVDGAVSQVGYAQEGQCVQAKGINYPVGKLLGDEASAHAFAGGAFATLYLSPRDYHRIHTPLSGNIVGYSYIPGEFWPVNQMSVRSKDALFCLNERLVTFIQNPRVGLMALIAVGATCVSRIRAAYDESITTHAGQHGKVHKYEKPIPIEKGDEVGRFEMGSTVILLFAPGKVRWDPSLREEAVVQMGRKIGEVT